MTFSFLHAADLHLGSPLRSLGRSLPASDAKRIRSLARRSFGNLVDAAISNEVDFVVLAGDIFDSAEREVASLDRFDSAMRRLADARIGAYLVLGNHDPVAEAFKPLRPLPESIHIFGSAEPDVVRHLCRSGETAVLAGQSYATKSESRNLVDRISKAVVGVREPIVGIAHCNVGSVEGFRDYAPCSTADVVASPVDYWALGHVHVRRVADRGNGRWWAYPGNLQGRGAGPAERGAKGALLVRSDAAGRGFLAPHFIPCGALRFDHLVVGAHDCADADEALALAASQVRQLVATSATDANCISIEFDVRGAVGRSLQSRLSDGSLLLDIRHDCASAIGDGAVIDVSVTATDSGIDRLFARTAGPVDGGTAGVVNDVGEIVRSLLGTNRSAVGKETEAETEAATVAATVPGGVANGLGGAHVDGLGADGLPMSAPDIDLWRDLLARAKKTVPSAISILNDESSAGVLDPFGVLDSAGGLDPHSLLGEALRHIHLALASEDA